MYTARLSKQPIVFRLAVLAAIWAFLLPDASIARDLPASDQLGQVHFPTSCQAAAQPTLEKALALMHSFQYTQAEETFSDAAKQDSQCAMAYWGKAMARYHQLWEFPQPGTLKEGLADIQQTQKLAPPTEREPPHLGGVATFYQGGGKPTEEPPPPAYSGAMAKLPRLAPQDIE